MESMGPSVEHCEYHEASDGTLKAASPVARIVSSREENERTDVDEEGFTWCGCGTSNAEAEGINISRLDTGVYVLPVLLGWLLRAGSFCRLWIREVWVSLVLSRQNRRGVEV